MKLVKVGVVAGALAAAGSAMADVPAAATAAFTSIQTDGTSLISSAWPVAAAITGGLILIKIFKKAVSKAT